MDSSRGFIRMRISTSEHAGYLRFRVQGPYYFEDFRLAVTSMRDACAQTGTRCALIDLRDVDGNMPDFDRFQIGQHFAETWGGGIKAAGLAPAEKINRFLENTAVNRQARLQIFTEEKDALEWLLKP